MNIIIAPDSFKGSLTSTNAATVMKDAVLSVFPNCHVELKPMADGGEGTLESLLTSLNGEKVTVRCMGPLGDYIQSSYGIVKGKTAIIEGANIAGLPQVPLEKRNPDLTTSYGIGEVLLDAVEKGCTSFIICLGGSATNDGGLGMLMALGLKAWDENGREVGPFGSDLLKVAKISFTELHQNLTSLEFKVACDVDNPLCGERGASMVFGPQKGATKEQTIRYDNALDKFGSLIEAEMNQELKEIPGAGAAGGLGFAFLALGASLISGAELVANTLNLEQAIKEADLVITGEGQSDEQTLYGKAPGFVADLSNKYHVPAVLISGSLSGNIDRLHKKFAGCFSIINKPITLEECMDRAEELLYEQTKQVIHFMKVIHGKRK